jgi:tetratricopeptide (TPR) repeat protein
MRIPELALAVLIAGLSACRHAPAPFSGGAGGAVSLPMASAGAGATSATKPLAQPSAPVDLAGAERAVPQGLTPGDVALHNLDDHIRLLELEIEAQGKAPVARRAELVDYLLSRSQFLSTFSDFQRAEELAEPAPAEFPRDPKALLLRARYRGAVHRFAEAESDLSSAEALGAAPRDTELQRASLHIAQGRELEAALAVAERRAKSLPALERLSVVALAEAALGRFEEADEHYRAALAAYRDVSPFPVAFVSFQRGVMWAELAAQPGRALPFYREAVRVLPQYVVGNVHLAELELQRGERPAAERRLRPLAHQSEDPEPWSALGQLLLQGKPDDAEGRTLIARAGRRYEQLLAQQRSAFLDHAAEFWLGPGADPARALELARANLALRPTGRAHQLVLEAALGLEDSQLFCREVTAAGAAARTNRNLSALIEAQRGRCAARAVRAASHP